MKHDQSIDPTGTFLVGKFRATYEELFKALGEPDTADSYKVSTEWRIEHDGQIYTIYDWKMTSNYDPDLPTPETLRGCPIPFLWHVGSRSEIGFELFSYELNKKIFNILFHEYKGVKK